MTSTVEKTVWEANVVAHEDPRLIGLRGQWWFTGATPEPGRCPGVGEDGRITSLPLPDLSTCDRAAALDYFDNSWALTESLFAGLQSAEAFYRPPDHNLRHPLIFYYGHPAVLYVNKLRVAGLLDKPVNGYLEQVLEVGVDEMSWDDLSKNEMIWPSVSDVHAYRAEVYRVVRQAIESASFAPDLGRPVTMDDAAWAIFLGFEHERIHLETSSVLIRELPVRLVSPPAAWPAPAPMRRTTGTGLPAADSAPANDLVPIAGGEVRLGKPRSFPSFGWDNEYGTRTEQVADFEAATFLVSNGEYHRFVADGGYRRPELWSDEGARWRHFRNAKWPRFWVPAGPGGLHSFRLRTTFEEIDMPWDWPVCVNYHEAKAFCAWRGEQDGRVYRLPTEAEFQRMRALDGREVADDPVMRNSGVQLREGGVNLNLAWGSESPVDASPASRDGLHDTAGNLWTWCEDVCNPLDGFAVHPFYEDFTTPCFDDQHQMILGGSFASTGDEASIWARFHFRPHFLQQSGIRVVSTAAPEPREIKSTMDADPYATRAMLDRYLLMHFASEQEMFELPDHPLAPAHAYPQRIAELLMREADRVGVHLNRVLDVGCAVGACSFALAEGGVPSVVGVDRSATFIDAARALADGEAVPYDRIDQGSVTTRLYARKPATAVAEFDFLVGDALALPDELGTFDAVVLANLLDRLVDPEACLRQFSGAGRLLRRGGLLLVASPWSWLTGPAAPELWLGGRDRSLRSEYALRSILATDFDLVAESDEAAILRDHVRHYEFLSADVTVWRKR
ncbi:5-histidylcysteine sulfoxide synthase [Allocatelliglobosispora scoriae]|uniref:5-histidylcysteine sulfoxide synthase n=1 Tax=Allocatelliglobosispora scoriae TaxID=643052 RepID=A0A841BX70_9ACTN|nr:5-histidylcysteine sulfoxide synthase [Allocatelliglobosispora scoriae]MBB5871739.1 5-histidylcysteine sulfoxide synthase [Allocatelliglobosispora scoriae]